MSDQVGPKLSAALRAQASGVSTGSPAGPTPAQPAGPPSQAQVRARPGLPGWAVLALAVLLGATAGGLAGVISTW